MILYSIFYLKLLLAAKQSKNQLLNSCKIFVTQN